MLDYASYYFKGKWTAEEEQRLSSAVHELSSTSSGEYITAGISWASVAERVGTRSEKQCRSKWYVTCWLKKLFITLCHIEFCADNNQENSYVLLIKESHRSVQIVCNSN